MLSPDQANEVVVETTAPVDVEVNYFARNLNSLSVKVRFFNVIKPGVLFKETEYQEGGKWIVTERIQRFLLVDAEGFMNAYGDDKDFRAVLEEGQKLLQAAAKHCVIRLHGKLSLLWPWRLEKMEIMLGDEWEDKGVNGLAWRLDIRKIEYQNC